MFCLWLQNSLFSEFREKGERASLRRERVLSSRRKIGIGLLVVTQEVGEGLSEQAKASLR